MNGRKHKKPSEGLNKLPNRLMAKWLITNVKFSSKKLFKTWTKRLGHDIKTEDLREKIFLIENYGVVSMLFYAKNRGSVL